MEDLIRLSIDEEKELNMSVPIPPSVNHIYYNTRGGGKRLTRLAENYVARVRALAHQEVEEQGWEKAKKGEWIYIDLAFYFPDKRIRDSHNCLKLLLDALEGIIFVNDYSVIPRIQVVELDRDNPRTLIKVSSQNEDERQNLLQWFCQEV